MTASATSRTGRDPAVAVWAVAGACWTLTAGFLLAGVPVSCHGGGDATALPAPLATVFAVWLVMAGAMMLPTVVPLVRLFVPVTARVGRPAVARLAFFAGYLAVWGGFAAAAVLGDSGVTALVGDRPWPVAPSEVLLGGTLVVAGFFQFSRLKRLCLTACRSPWAFLWQHYRRGSRGGWRLGVRHGVLCLGCCWALMLVMFGAGVGSLLWMTALTGVMVVERTAPHGARLVAPLGGALVLAGVVVCVMAVSAPGGSAGRAGTADPGLVALLVAAAGLALFAPVRRRPADSDLQTPVFSGGPRPAMNLVREHVTEQGGSDDSDRRSCDDGPAPGAG